MSIARLRKGHTARKDRPVITAGGLKNDNERSGRETRSIHQRGYTDIVFRVHVRAVRDEPPSFGCVVDLCHFHERVRLFVLLYARGLAQGEKRVEHEQGDKVLFRSHRGSPWSDYSTELRRKKLPAYLPRPLDKNPRSDKNIGTNRSCPMDGTEIAS